MSTEFPDHLVKYGETAIFNEKSVPAKLTTQHDTKRGVWGKLIVRSGALNYVIQGPPLVRERIGAGAFATIEPEIKHWVEIVGPVEFQVEFYRQATEN